MKFTSIDFTAKKASVKLIVPVFDEDYEETFSDPFLYTYSNTLGINKKGELCWYYISNRTGTYRHYEFKLSISKNKQKQPELKILGEYEYKESK